MRAKLALIGKDDPVTKKVLGLITQVKGFKVVYFPDPREGKVASQLKPHAIIVQGNIFLNYQDKLKTQWARHSIPIMAYTLDPKEEQLCMEQGASDVVLLPLQEGSLTTRVRNQLKIKNLMDEMEKVDNVLFTIAKIVEAKDYYTKGHIHRVTSYSYGIGLTMGLTERELKTLKIGALLHDIGKIAIPDSILAKEGTLTKEEMDIMKQHPLLGYRICKPLSSLNGALDIILYHHEKWDGTGYPQGLAGLEIPFLARVVAVADTFDAVSSSRNYMERTLSRKDALILLEEEAGTHFDPDVVEAFLKHLRKGSKR